MQTEMTDDIGTRETDTWAGRLGDQKTRLKNELEGSGQTARDFIAELLDLRELQRKTISNNLDHLPELNGIDEHLSIISRLARSMLVTAKDEVIRHAMRFDEVQKKLNEHIVKAHEDSNTMKLRLEAVELEKANLAEENGENLRRIYEIQEENKTLLMSLQRLEKAWNDASHKIDSADQFESELKMKNLQLTAALDEKNNLARKLRDKEDELTQVLERHKQETMTAGEWAEIRLQKALVEQQTKDLHTIQELKDKISELRMSTH